MIQGVGALGVAGVAGNALVSASGDSAAVQQDGAALRVAHASPDTPSIDVTLRSAEGDATDTETDGGAGTETAVGGDGPLVDGLEFGNVSSYNEVDPGTYQIRIVATESTGFLEGIFGEADERVIYDEEVELEEGTTYTAVAYGKLRETALGETSTETDTPGLGEETPTETAATPTDGEDTSTDEAETPGLGEETPTATTEGGDADGEVVIDRLAYGEHESFTAEAGDYTLEFRETTAAGEDTVGAETPTDDAATPTDDGVTGSGEASDDDRPLTVALLEDDLSAPGDSAAEDEETTAGAETPDGTPTDGGAIGQETATETDGASPAGEETETDGAELTRIRVFHAVLDADALEVVAVQDGGDGGGIFGGGDGEGETETEAATQTPTADGAAEGDAEETTTAGAETETDAGDEGSVQEAQISPEAGTAYSGFAVGYFDPSAAETGEQTPTDEGAPTGGEATDTDAEGAGQTETAATETVVGTEEIAEEGTEEFQFVVAEDATDGERADGGSDDGGILPEQSAPEAPLD
ncbi:DUF4397 domain-containing protein [Halosimplex sp. TS25]|uniref:DUF4397 domain-containing protein n=1 Tax=Halosimplex rarum TaxID=3396619 RepID=UPI0039E7A47D